MSTSDVYYYLLHMVDHIVPCFYASDKSFGSTKLIYGVYSHSKFNKNINIQFKFINSKFLFFAIYFYLFC